jgi:hypothetical protein
MRGKTTLRKKNQVNRSKMKMMIVISEQYDDMINAFHPSCRYRCSARLESTSSLRRSKWKKLLLALELVAPSLSIRTLVSINSLNEILAVHRRR